jgi:hypothetical protein
LSQQITTRKPFLTVGLLSRSSLLLTTALALSKNYSVTTLKLVASYLAAVVGAAPSAFHVRAMRMVVKLA